MLIAALLLLSQSPDIVALESPAQEPAEIPRHTQIYEIATLLQDQWSAVTPEAAEGSGLATSGGSFWDAEVSKSETWKGSTDAAHPYETAADLLGTIRAFMWPVIDSRFESIQLKKGYLYANLRKEQHEWLRAFLDRLRGAHIWQGRVDAHFLTLPRGGAAKLGLKRSATTLHGAQETRAFMAKVEASEHKVMASPSLMAGAAQRVRMSIINQVAYIRDFELKIVQPGNVEIADPVVDVVHEGNILDLRMVDVGGGLYGMELQSTVAQLTRPIKTRVLRLGPIKPMEMEIGVPEVITAGIDAQLRLASGDSVVLFSPSAGDFDLLVVVSFTAIPLPPPPVAPPAPSAPSPPQVQD